jgi:uncharacterized membrane protein YbhN (UPF0104 family)
MKLLLRVIVTASIFVLVLRSIDLKQIWSLLHQARMDLLAMAILLQFGSTTVSAYRWRLIMNNLQFGQPFIFYWRSYFKAMFFNQGLPTSIGGDAVRVFDIAGLGFRKRDAFYGVLLDRATGLIALMLLNIIAYLLNPGVLPAHVYNLVFFLIIIGLTGLASVILLGRLQWVNGYRRLVFLKTLSEKLGLAFGRHYVLMIGLSLIIPLLALLGFFATGWALGLRYELMTYFIVVPPALLLTMIPVSLAGWGVREGALVALFSLVGADQATVLTLSVLYGLTLIIVSVPGLVIYLGGVRRPVAVSQPYEPKRS